MKVESNIEKLIDYKGSPILPPEPGMSGVEARVCAWLSMTDAEFEVEMDKAGMPDDMKEHTRQVRKDIEVSPLIEELFSKG